MSEKRMIKNFERLASSPLRRQALLIAEAGLESINTAKAFERNFVYDSAADRLRILGKKYGLSEFRNVYCIAFGKAAFEGISSASRILGQRLTSGFAIDVSNQYPNIPNIVFRTGTHPHPSEQNVKAAKELVLFAGRAKEDDLVLCLISGGGSSLLCYPHTLDARSQAAIIKELMNSGADIFEMNAVRKHLSAVKGGQLAKIVYPAHLISLIFSDVPGDDLSTIASGPTARDETTVRDATRILDKHRILEKLNISSVNPVKSRTPGASADAQAPLEGSVDNNPALAGNLSLTGQAHRTFNGVKFLETPKEEKYFKKAENILFVSAKTALNAMRNKAEDLGFEVKIFSEKFQGEARGLAGEIIKANDTHHQCLLGAGESTVVVKGHGVGGRNQEMALAALSSISENQTLITLASDGHDNSEAAGAIVDMSAIERAKNLELDPIGYLENNDSFSFFESVGDSIETGLTGSNVADLVICLKS